MLISFWSYTWSTGIRINLYLLLFPKNFISFLIKRTVFNSYHINIVQNPNRTCLSKKSHLTPTHFSSSVTWSLSWGQCNQFLGDIPQCANCMYVYIPFSEKWWQHSIYILLSKILSICTGTYIKQIYVKE